MRAGWRGRPRGAPAVALLLLAAASAYAASPPGGDANGNSTATPEDRPPAAAEPSPPPAPPPDASKKVEPAPPKNLETLAPGDAIGLLGKKVRDAAGEDMGMVVDVLVDGVGRPRAAVIDFGGFLGVGSRKIAVDWRLLQLKPVDGTLSVLLTLTRAEVQAAPEYKPPGTPAQPVMVVGPPPPSTGAPPPANAPK
jgi:PRC-barrel domain